MTAALRVDEVEREAQVFGLDGRLGRLYTEPTRARKIDDWLARSLRRRHGLVTASGDTCDAAHDHQQLSLFNALHDALPAARPCLPCRAQQAPGGLPVALHDALGR